MPQYIVFINRKKRHEETLNQYYDATILGLFDAPDVTKALKHGAIHFSIEQWQLDVKAFRNALDQEKKIAVRKSEVK